MRVSLTLALSMSTAIETDMGRRRGVLRAGKLPKNAFSRGVVFLPLFHDGAMGLEVESC